MFDYGTRLFDHQLKQAASPATAGLLDLSCRLGWKPQVLGRAPLPRTPVFLSNRWFVPIEQDKSPIPQHAQERVGTIYRSGLRPQGFVVIHEAPKSLAPQAKPHAPERGSRREVIRSLPWQRILPVVACAVAIVLTGPLLVKLLVALVTAFVVAIAAALFLPLLAIGLVGAVLVDPMLVAVTEDGYWVVIDQWWTV